MSRDVTTLASGFVQTAYVVRDIRAAEAFFIEKLGVTRFMRFDKIEPRHRTYRGRPSDYKMHLSMGVVGNGSIADPFGSTVVELIQPLFGESIYQEFLDGGREGLHHVGYAVKEYERTVTEWLKRGFEIIQTGQIGEIRFCYVEAPVLGRSVIEFIEAGPDFLAVNRKLIHGEF